MNLSDETWLSKNHPVRLTCGLIAHSAILLAGALAVIWFIDHARLPTTNFDFGPAQFIERTYLDLADLVERNNVR